MGRPVLLELSQRLQRFLSLALGLENINQPGIDIGHHLGLRAA